MKKSTNFEMFVEAKHYIDKHHSGNPIDFVINGYICLMMRRNCLLINVV